MESYSNICGYGLISGAGTNFGTIIVRLKHWDERKGIQHIIDMVIARLYYACEDIKEATIIPFQMPQIPGYGNSNSIELVMEDLQHFVRRKHQQAGNAIIAGENAISPYRMKSKSACDFCNFKAVCQFDPSSK